MGVTIHFEGKLQSAHALERVITLSCSFADSLGWPWNQISDAYVKLERVHDEKPWDYEGPVKGIVLHPSEDCDPLRLEFDKDLYLQEYCKTQFAGSEIHVAVVELLRSLEPSFVSLTVFDEGEYWETGSLQTLNQHLSNCYSALKDELKKCPNGQTKVKLPSGRIIDLMT